MTNTTQRTARELTPAIGAQVLVRFEGLSIRCTVVDAKNSWNKVRLLVQPVAGQGQQWIELGRLVTPEPEYACGACARDIQVGGVSDDEGRLALTGRFTSYGGKCALCGGAGTHEYTRRQEVL